MKLVNGIYVDIENSDLANLNVIIGARGPGKTFSVLKHRIEDSAADETEQSKYRYDFYLEQYNTLIEYDGRQHFYSGNSG